MTFVSFSLWVAFTMEQAAPALPVRDAKPAASDLCTYRGTFQVKDDDGKLVKPEAAQVFVSSTLSKYRRAPAIVRLGQKNRRFIPEFLVLQTDDTLRVVNEEDGAVIHGAHIDFYANVVGTPNSARLITAEYPMTQVGESYVRCSQHEHMKATVLTVPNRFHASVAADGTWELRDVPRGVNLTFWSFSSNRHNATTLFARSCVDPIEIVATLGAELPPPPHSHTMGGIYR